MEKSKWNNGIKNKSFAYSTPKIVPVSSRTGIHDVSPIATDSDDYESSSEAENKLDETPNKNLNLKREKAHLDLSKDDKSTSNFTNVRNVTAIVAFLVILFGIIVSGKMSTDDILEFSINDIENNFPSQGKDMWTAFESGIKETKQFNKPSVFLVLHEEQSSEIVNSLLANMTTYASCILNQNCNLKPIMVDSKDIIKETSGFDYGFIINKYKPQLEERAVFVMFNLDQLPGELAQAFHSMCDEFNPLVKKTVYFFTVKVDGSRWGGSDLALVERILKNKWSDLKDDIFFPLFTRISSMVLRVVPENKL